MLLFSGFLIHNIIYKPFPFFKVNYINNKNVFNSDPLNNANFYELKINGSLGSSSQINLQIEKIKNATRLEKIIYATELTREIQEKSLGNKIKTYDELLLVDSKFKEICSESSKIFLYLMKNKSVRLKKVKKVYL